MVKNALFTYLLLSHISPLFGVVLLEPVPWDRSTTAEAIERNPLCTSFSRGEGSQLNTVRGSLIITLRSRPQTELQCAAVDENIELVRALLKNNVDPNIQNHHGFTALHFAVTIGNPDIIELLLSHGANPNIQDDLAHATALHIAFIDNGCGEIIKLLIDYGANVTIPDIYGYTPLHTIAAASDYAGNEGIEIARMLLHAKADINAFTHKSTEARMQSTSMLKCGTPLHEAAAHGYSTMAEFLIQQGASVESVNLDQKTPLHLALTYGHTATARILLQYTRNVGTIPMESLKQAILKGDCELAELVITLGVDVNGAITGKDKNGSYELTPLCGACQTQYADSMVPLLLKHGALVNKVDSSGSTPLIYATERSDEKAVMHLIEAGADVNIANQHGETPLHFAVLRKNLNLAKLLIEKGARLDAKLIDSNATPLDLAKELQAHDLVLFLRTLTKDTSDTTTETCVKIDSAAQDMKVNKLMLEHDDIRLEPTEKNIDAPALDEQKPTTISLWQKGLKIIRHPLTHIAMIFGVICSVKAALHYYHTGCIGL